MGNQNAFGIHSVQHGTTVISGLTQSDLGLETQLSDEPTSDQLHAMFLSMQAQGVNPSFTSHAIGALLGVAGTYGAAISETNPFVCYCQKHKHAGTRDTTGHLKYTMLSGLLYPTELSVSHGSTATLSAQVAVCWDGTNAPASIAAASLPTTLTETEKYGLGPIEIAGSTLTGVTDLNLSFGLEVEAESSDGDIWPSFVSVKRAMPILTLSGRDLTWSSNLGIGGSAVTPADTILYLRRKTSSGSYVDDATANHIKLVFNGMVVPTNLFSGSAGSKATNALQITGSATDAVSPLAITTACAIA